jgi:hypothetical protein
VAEFSRPTAPSGEHPGGPDSQSGENTKDRVTDSIDPPHTELPHWLA